MRPLHKRIASIRLADAGEPADEAGTLAHARRAGRPRGAHALQIAATARATGRMLLTTDQTAFDELPGVTYRLATTI